MVLKSRRNCLITIEENGKKVNKGDFAIFLKEKLKTEIPVISTWHYSYVWNRCQLRKEERDNPRALQVRPGKLAEYEMQHKKILKYL